MITWWLSFPRKKWWKTQYMYKYTITEIYAVTSTYCTYPTGRGIAIEPANSPAATTFKFNPKTILHSLRNETVQKGRTKSWLSICGGMQSPSSYMFTIQLSGTHVGGRTCHLTSLLIITLNRWGIGSTSSFWRIPGGLPFLSCTHIYSWNHKVILLTISHEEKRLQIDYEAAWKNLLLRNCNNNRTGWSHVPCPSSTSVGQYKFSLQE